MSQSLSFARQALDTISIRLQQPQYRWLSVTAVASIILTSFYLANSKSPNNEIAASLKRTRESKQCRYRLDDDSSATLTLPDGRKLGYAQYGSLTGRPVLYMHGLPGSRSEAAMFDDMAKRAGVRIISVDRPGLGWSSPHPNRTILDHAKDVERLTEYLELEEYGVLGQSGGGPYTLACAFSLPADKLKAVAIVCGLGPPDMGVKGMQWSNWLGFAFANRYFPWIVRLWFQRDPMGRLDLSDERRLELLHQQFASSNPPQKDVEALVHKDPDLLQLALRSARESFAQGFGAFAEDARLLASDFGFRIEDIRPDLPVRLWYGKQDVNVPAEHGVQTAARLRGNRVQLRVEDETHASLEINWDEEALQDLVMNM